MIISAKPCGSDDNFKNVKFVEGLAEDALKKGDIEQKREKERTRREAIYGFAATFVACFRRAIGQDK